MKKENKDITEVQENVEKVADETKRDFMKKFGNYAASVPLAGFVLMTVGSSQNAVASDNIIERFIP